MFKYVLHIIIGTVILMISSFIAWYEGSAITYRSWEWKYSTPFTKLFNTEIQTGQDINQLDYFVYAGKFQPFFPVLMTISVLYIISVIIFYLIKNKFKWASIFGGLVSVSLLACSGLVNNPSTIGGWIFFWIFLSSGLIYTVMIVSLAIYRNGVLSK